MQIPSPELVRRIESLVSSLLGVTESRVEREASGAIHSLHASVAPGHSPDRVRREIRSALLSSLDLDLDPDVVSVEVEQQLGRRQEQFWEGPERNRGEDGSRGVEQSRDVDAGSDDFGVFEESVGEAVEEAVEAFEDSVEQSGDDSSGESAGPEEWLARADAAPRSPETPAPEDRRSSQDPSVNDPADIFEPRTPPEARGRTAPVSGEPPDRDEAAPAEDPAPAEGPDAAGEAAPAGEADAASSAAPEDPGRLLPLSLGEYVLLGGGGREVGVELRIRVLAGEDPFVGTVRVASLEDVSPGLFVGATLRAVERALDARPVSERSDRILILEAVDMEEVVLREGRFVAATVQALHRDGESRATGLAPAEGRVLREAAAEAALDAVTRILEGRHTRRIEGRGRIRRGMREDHRSERGESRGGSPESRDPFHVWE